MDSATIGKLGIIFFTLGIAATFLMYRLWGYPFDKETKTSAAPKPLMYLHRALGYAFFIVYILIMWQMVPRLWEYQVEFPARTVAHIVLGVTIGFLLIIKIAIMRFFRHFEEWMPYLGTAIMLGTVILLGLSVPFIFQERALAGEVYSKDNLERVEGLLPKAGLPPEAKLDELATVAELRKGRQVLLRNCVKCHDLRTVIVKPRTPDNWHRTVVRMAEKPALFDPIGVRDQWRVTAYLIAITPDLQKAQKRLRDERERIAMSEKVADEISMTEPSGEGEGEGASGEGEGEGAGDEGDGKGEGEGAGEGEGEGEGAAPSKPERPEPMAGLDREKAKAAYEEECSLCHELSDVDGAPPESPQDIDAVFERMIENGMEIDDPETIALIKAWLLNHFVNKTWN